MLEELAGVLGVAIDEMAPVFRTSAPRPLKIGAYHDLLERYPGADITGLKRWLRQWCGSLQYLRAIDAGTTRHDLDGLEAGRISAVARAQARVGLERHRRRREGVVAPSAGGSVSSRPGRPVLRLPSLRRPAP